MFAQRTVARFRVALLILFSTSLITARSQQPLNRSVSLEVQNQRLDHVLELLSNQGNFFFSYNSSIIKKDSLVSARMTNSPVHGVLRSLLGSGYEFRESGNYIILRRAPIRVKMITSSAQTADKFYVISGYVIDDQTGERISQASVYEKDRLSLANTNKDGYFSLRLKNRYKTASLSVSKAYYEDTTVTVQPKYNQMLHITLVPMEINERTVIIGPDGYQAPKTIDLEIPVNDSMSWRYTYQKTDSALVERTGIGKWLVSSGQKIQSINLQRFFVARPYQVSVIPRVSTNGRMNSQVTNHFSLNIFGGYSAGTNGLELGGLFNINKKDARYVQVAGLFNLVGGTSAGVQVAGISNTVLYGVKGLQVGGITNFAKRDVKGMQVGGIYNHIGDSINGVQIAGVANVSTKEVKGVQIAGVFNYTKRLKGVQIGLINIADTSSGYSIGLINIVLKGYHKLSLSTNEVMNLNAAFKTGNTKLYSIFLGGYNSVPGEKVWSFGYGLGSEQSLSKKFTINPELTSQHLYLGSWDYYNLQNKISLSLNYKFGKYFSLYAGPAYSVYVSNQDISFEGYKSAVPPPAYNAHTFSNSVTGWLGWTAGLHIF